MQKKPTQFPLLLVCLSVVMLAPPTAGLTSPTAWLAPSVAGLGDSLPVAALQQNAAPSQEPTDPEKQFKLAKKYLEGEGVPQDNAEAVKWFRKAAEQGHARAQAVLGFMYANGRGVPQDYAEAAKWHHKAAEQGVAEAQSTLGVMYAKSRGVPQDHAAAVR